MANENNILLEIKEDMQRDQMMQFFKKNATVISVLLVVGLAVIIAYEVWKNYDLKNRADAGDKLYAVISDFNTLKSPKPLRDVRAQAPAYKSIVELVEANWHESQLDGQEMKKAYQELADDKNANMALRDLAKLNLVSMQLNTGAEDKSAEADLIALSSKGRVYRFTALEMLGAYYKKKGRTEEARKTYEELANDTAAPASLAGRAKSMLSSF